MIIVEGPDGAGKSTLINKLHGDLGLPIHSRGVGSDSSPLTAATSEESRGTTLSRWAYNDVSTMDDQSFSIYDRHCLISEYIYGPIVRGDLDINMLSPIMHLCIRMMAERCLVIFCRPSDDTIFENLSQDEVSNQVVGNNIKSIIYAYDALKMFWPGESIYYDYTKDPATYQTILGVCRLHIAHQTQKRNRNA